jgi:tripartite-type tricarboxylate transporter receptor subunit TctC
MNERHEERTMSILATLQRTAALACATTLLWAAGAAHAQTADKFPSRQVTVIVGFGPGGGGDIVSRWMAEYLRERWKVPVVVENRPGAGATIAAAQLARAKPDGYTVALATTSPFTVAPYLQPVQYDVARDFTFLFQMLVSPQPLFVRTDSPHRSWADLVAWARANPGKVLWSTAATNGGTHIATEAALRSLGIQATYVPYKGGAEVITALLGGEIMAVVSDSFGPFATAGQVRLLVETSPDKFPDYPALQTFSELNYPLSVRIFYGLAAPAGIPADALAAWEAAAQDMVKSKGYQDLMARQKTAALYQSSAEFTASILEVNRRMGKLVPELGFK